MSISAIQGSAYSNYISPFGSYKNTFAESAGNSRNTGPDTVSFSEEALKMAQKNTSQSSTAETVKDWYNNDFKNGAAGNYGEWLPENYAKFKELTEGTNLEPTYSCKLGMVFSALGKDKAITDQDIAEGIKAIEEEMTSLKQPTTLDELNALLKPLPGADTIAQGQKGLAEAERKLQKWQDEVISTLLEESN